jgi:predicted nuclease with RNAse H fold
MWAGIDYGSKTAGTTVICYGNRPDKLQLFGTIKKQDADLFLLNMIKNIKPEFICIDAPLSLPGIYTNKKYTNYFYRKVDKELGAMSPMFLGGLTARAMKLKADLISDGIDVYEAYPASLVKHFELTDSYNKKIPELIPQFLQILQHTFNIKVDRFDVPNWHYMDALLCWITAYRISQQKHRLYGDVHEGIIYI